MNRHVRLRNLVVGAALLGCLAVTPAAGHAEVGTTFPDDFPVIVDASLGVPVIGFGDRGPIRRTPVVFLHGNNDTPYPTTCNGGFGKIQDFAQYLADHGWATSELWALGYQGDQCDLLTSPSNRSGQAHTTAANVDDVHRFIHAVLDYTGARQVDIVGHSLGATLARDWMRQDRAHHLVRRLVSVDGPHHGIINCSPSPANYWQQDALGGFTPDSPICTEYGAADTAMLVRLNSPKEAFPPTRYQAIVNTDRSFVFFPVQDGLVPPVPAENRRGEPHDFSGSGRLAGAETVGLTDQGRYDPVLQSSHLGIVNSPETWEAARRFLAAAR